MLATFSQKIEHTKELFKSANVLNLYKLNILSIAVFLHSVHTKTSAPVFTGSCQSFSSQLQLQLLSVFYKIVNFEIFKT